jgi:hypothetical protein
VLEETVTAGRDNCDFQKRKVDGVHHVVKKIKLFESRKKYKRYKNILFNVARIEV